MAFFRDDQHVHDSRWKIMIIIVIALLLMFGVFVIKGGSERHHPASATITAEELQIIDGYIQHLEELNRINEELIELYQLKRLQEEGKLHSS